MRSSVHPEDIDSQSKSNGPTNEVELVYLDEISSTIDDNTGTESGLLDCRIIPSNCLPCLANTVPPVEKRRSLSSNSPPNTRKKFAHKLSFKLKDGNPSAINCEYLAFQFILCLYSLGTYHCSIAIS